jgi:hypothetical protein
MNVKTQKIYDEVFQHPTSQRLEWCDVKAMFEEIGMVEEQRNGNMKVTIHGHSMVFKSPSLSAIASNEQITEIQKMLKAKNPQENDSTETQFLVVLDHQEARVYAAESSGAIGVRFTPVDHEGHTSHVHSAHDYRTHAEEPNHDHYYAAIAKSLKGADQILVFGSGEGSSSAKDKFVKYLAEKEPKIQEHIVGIHKIDASHMSENELLAKAREVFEE